MAFQEAGYHQRYNSRRGPAPFTPDLRNFLKESRRKQTFYKNCEGSYDRRKLTGRNMLEDFIVNSIYKTESSFSTDSNFYDSHKVDLLTDKIISRNNIYRREEIHIFVVWVYYFDYDQARSYTTPVFKIFRTADDDNVEFVDISGKFYKSWDNYVENAKFPESFLCVPRDGKYTFVDDCLDLEFVRANSTENRRSFSVDRETVPFFERFILPCFRKIKTFSGKLRENFKKVFKMLMHYFEPYKGIIGAVCVGVVAMGATLVATSGTLTGFLPSVCTIGSMLFNTCKNLLGPGMNRGPLPDVHSLPSSAELSRPGIGKEVEKFIALLKSPIKEWREILKSFCLLFRECCHVLLQILKFLPPCPGVSGLTKFLLAADACAMIPELMTNDTGSTNYDAPWKNPRQISNNTSISHSSLKSIDPPRVQRETKGNSTEIVSRRELPASDNAWEVAVKQLDFLGKASPMAVTHVPSGTRPPSNLPEEDSPMTMTTNSQELRSFTRTPNNLVIATIDDNVLLVFPNARVGYFVKCLADIFPGAKKINIIRSDLFDVVDSEGKKLTTLFFPADHIAVCLSPKNAVSPEVYGNLLA